MKKKDERRPKVRGGSSTRADGSTRLGVAFRSHRNATGHPESSRAAAGTNARGGLAGVTGGAKSVCKATEPIYISSESSQSSGSDIWSDYYYSSGTETADNDPWNVIETTLDYPFKAYLELLGGHGRWGDTRWISINTESGRVYMVKLIKKRNYYVLSTGWTLVVVAEGLKAEQEVCFEYQAGHVELSTEAIPDNNVGFAPALPADEFVEYDTEDYYVGEKTNMSDAVFDAMDTIWVAAAPRSPMFVCTIRKSQVNKGYMFFSTEYSKELPKKKETVALRFVGSPITTCGAIHRYDDDSSVAWVTKGWDQFVVQHRIEEGDVLVFRCYHGPSVWELLVCRA